MDNKFRTVLTEMRKMSSSHAADWLIKNYPTDEPNYWEALQLISHISWKRADQVRLANFYLKKMPFASSTIYEIFASLMSFDLFVKIIRELLPTNKSDVNLVLYHLQPVLKKAARTASDHELMASFLAELE